MELTAALKQQLDTIGPVRHIVSPNYEHTKFARQWKDAYPEATLYGCPGLPTKSPDKQCATTCSIRFQTLFNSSRLPRLIQRSMCCRRQSGSTPCTARHSLPSSVSRFHFTVRVARRR